MKHFGEKDWLKIVAGLSLPVIDLIWMEHLVDMDHVREGIGLRGYAQRDPIVEYKREGHERFDVLVQKIYTNVGERLSKVSGEVAAQKQRGPKENLDYAQGSLETGVAEEAKAKRKTEPVRSSKDKVGRNDPCPCGSGLKYKKCGMINSPQHQG